MAIDVGSGDRPTAFLLRRTNEMMITNVTPETAWETAKSELPGRLDALRQRSYFELLALPPHENETVQHGDHELRWTVYRDVLEDQSLIVVVQLGMKTGRLLRRFEMGNVIADGFRIDRHGTTYSMTREELYEFM